MYKDYKNTLIHSSKKCSVIYEYKVGGGLFGNLTNIVGGNLANAVGSNLANAVGGLLTNSSGGQASNLIQGLLPGSDSRQTPPPPGYIRNPGIAIMKTSYIQMKSELLRTGQIFWDSEFPVNRIELMSENNQIEWKRPFEISQNPNMFTAGISRFDVNQGKLGDCWLLAAISSLVIHQNLLTKVVPLDQSFNKGDYCGIFRFYIWYYGQWIETIIDDLLPTVNNQLIYMSSNDPNEFWSALLEKAYAKIHGSFKNLSGGSTSDAMVDFTGGITERIKLRKNQSLVNDPRQINELFFIIIRAYSNQALMSCSKEGGLEFKDSSGLVSRHAYSITAVCLVNTIGYGQVNLIRLRNPWGDETEWKGPWSDNSYEWQHVPQHELKRLQIIRRGDGEFWMAFHDFVNNFDKIEICHIEPQSMEDLGQLKNREFNAKKSWELTVFYGNWIRGVSAGGCSDHQTYSMNPQFELTVLEPDDQSADGTGTVLVGLMQRNLRMFRREMVPIGYSIFTKPKGLSGMILKHMIKGLPQIATTGAYTDVREVTGRYKLYPGSYIIIPSTFKPDQEGQFMIRIFSVKKTQMIAYTPSTN